MQKPVIQRWPWNRHILAIMVIPVAQPLGGAKTPAISVTSAANPAHPAPAIGSGQNRLRVSATGSFEESAPPAPQSPGQVRLSRTGRSWTASVRPRSGRATELPLRRLIGAFQFLDRGLQPLAGGAQLALQPLDMLAPATAGA